MKVLFVAMEAGAAAWMEPVWARIPGGAVIALSEPAVRHLEAGGSKLPASRLGTGDDLAAVLRDDDFDRALISATGHGTEQQVVRHCNASGVPAIQVVDTWAGYARRFGPEVPAAVAVIDEVAEQECRNGSGLSTRYIHVGHPAWESITELAPAADARCVLFVGQPIHRSYGARLGYDERTALALVLKLLDQRPGLAHTLTYLLHPLETEAPCVVHATRQARDALSRCGTVIGMFSSLLVEAALAGRRVIVLQPGDGADQFGPSRHGLLPRTRTADELEAELASTATWQGRDILRRKVEGSADRVLRHLAAMQ